MTHLRRGDRWPRPLGRRLGCARAAANKTRRGFLAELEKKGVDFGERDDALGFMTTIDDFERDDFFPRRNRARPLFWLAFEEGPGKLLRGNATNTSICAGPCVDPFDDAVALCALDGGVLASGSVDKSIRLWALTNAAESYSA